MFPDLDAESAAKIEQFFLQTAQMSTAVPHVLYRHFDTHGALLYVGISQRRQRKTRQTTHACESRWWAFVERTEVDEDYGDEKAARAAEVAAIEKEQPIFNLDRNGPPGAQRKRELAYIRSRICRHEHVLTEAVS